MSGAGVRLRRYRYHSRRYTYRQGCVWSSAGGSAEVWQAGGPEAHRVAQQRPSVLPGLGVLLKSIVRSDCVSQSYRIECKRALDSPDSVFIQLLTVSTSVRSYCLTHTSTQLSIDTSIRLLQHDQVRGSRVAATRPCCFRSFRAASRGRCRRFLEAESSPSPSSMATASSSASSIQARSRSCVVSGC